MSALIRIIQLILIALITLQTLAFTGVPLFFGQNDSGWYYTSAQYFFSHDSRHLDGAIYPLWGYPLIIYITKLIETLIGVSWFKLLSLAQFLLHLLTGFLLFKTTRLFTFKATSWLCVLAYFLYFPFLNFSTFVMTETLSIFIILLYVWLIFKGWLQDRPRYFYLGVLVASYAFLIKPVIALQLPLALLGLWAKKRHKGRPHTIKALLLTIVLASLIPLAHVVANKTYFGEYTLRKGLGWNLWNRVILQDATIPRLSPEFKNLEAIFTKHGDTLPLGHWWLAAGKLRQWGYSHEDTQKFCLEVAVAAIRERPIDFAWLTVLASGKLLFYPQPARNIYSSTDQYYAFLDSYAKDSAAPPGVLSLELLRQRADKLSYIGLKIYNDLARLHHEFFDLAVHFLMVCAFILGGLLACFRFNKNRDQASAVKLAVFLLPIIFIVGSALAEQAHSRLNLPALPFIMIGAVIFCTEWLLVNTISQLKKILRISIGIYLTAHLFFIALQIEFTGPKKLVIETLISEVARPSWACRQTKLFENTLNFEYRDAKALVSTLRPLDCRTQNISLRSTPTREFLSQAILYW